MPQALPGVSASSPPVSRTNGSGLLRLVSNSELDARESERLAQRLQAAQRTLPTQDIGAYVRQRWMAFRNNRNSGLDPLSERLLRAQRMFEGKYDPGKLA